MAERNTNQLDGLSGDAPEAGVQPETRHAAADAVKGVLQAVVKEAVLVDLNYPNPTLLSLIIKDVAHWSGHCFVMEPAINTRLQIFAPHKLESKEAYELFLASLSVVGLRAVQLGSIVKIVPVIAVISA